MLDAKNLFRKEFGQTPTHLVRAPGRLELLGNHTDYNEGLVLSLAVDRYIEIAASPRLDGKIELISTSFPEPEIFWSNETIKNPAAVFIEGGRGARANVADGLLVGGFGSERLEQVRGALACRIDQMILAGC